MKICHMCGCEVEDKDLICPDCGATVVKATMGLSLKAEQEKHKTVTTMGKTIGSGSGYTDILRAEEDDVAEDDPFRGGSIPASMARNFIEEEERKKKQKHTRTVKTIIKVVVFLAIVIGAILFVTKVLLKKKGVESATDAIDVFVEAINDNDAGKLKQIMLPYYNQSEEAQDMIDMLSNVTITSNKVVSHEDISRVELDLYQQQLKAEKDRMVDIHDGVTYVLELRGTTVKADTNVEIEFGGEIELQFFKIKGLWYLNTDELDYDFFLRR